MKDGDRIVTQCKIQRETRPYYPRDKIANRYFIGQVIGDMYCADPKILFPKVFYTGELKWSVN